MLFCRAYQCRESSRLKWIADLRFRGRGKWPAAVLNAEHLPRVWTSSAIRFRPRLPMGKGIVPSRNSKMRTKRYVHWQKPHRQKRFICIGLYSEPLYHFESFASLWTSFAGSCNSKFCRSARLLFHQAFSIKFFDQRIGRFRLMFEFLRYACYSVATFEYTNRETKDK